jgi:hypothetical protein
MTCRTALAIYLGCALMAVWAILRAWDHFHGRPPVTPPWEEPLPTPDPRPWRLILGTPAHEPYPVYDNSDSE